MSLQKKVKNESNMQRLNLRLDQEIFDEINEVAETTGRTLSAVIREMLVHNLNEAAEQEQREMIERAKTKATSEMLYILRELADKTDPSLTDRARQHAETMMNELYPGEE